MARRLQIDIPSERIEAFCRKWQVREFAINRQGTGILLVEQNATQALEIAHRGYVLRLGSVFEAGSGRELPENGALKRAWVGG